jgi:hypothetical protein
MLRRIDDCEWKRLPDLVQRLKANDCTENMNTNTTSKK